MQFLSKGIVGVDAKTGEFLWRYAEVAKGMAQIPTPVARDGSVYGAAMEVGGGLVRLKSDGNGVAAEQVYFARGLPSNIGGDVVRIADTAPAAGSKTLATTVVLLDRGIGLLGLMLMAAVGASAVTKFGSFGPLGPGVLWGSLGFGAIVATPAVTRTVAAPGAT